jgi:phage shock protein PspC (stress-responsive transcriptional regulator)
MLQHPLILKIATFMEQRTFGVCAWLGEKLQMKSANIRLFFIYASFITIGSPIIIYLIMAFVLNLRNLIRAKRSSVWDL